MLGIYSRPLRVYIVLAALALWGVLSGFQLPISLFPNSSQVRVVVRIPYGSMSATQFFESYGKKLEAELQGIKVDNVGVQLLTAKYKSSGADYRMIFDWGAEPDQAMRDVETKVNSRFSSADEDVRVGIRVDSWKENQGFIAISFYSPLRSLDEIYDILEPLVSPIASKVADAAGLELYNPNQKEVTITPILEKLAQFEVTTSQLQLSIQEAVSGMSGGSMKIGDNEYQLELPKFAADVTDFGQIQIARPQKRFVFLKDIAKISVGLSLQSKQRFKTSGVESLILFADPKEGGNIKKMADQIISELSLVKSKWPADIQSTVLVNPSEFINKSILGVIKEVFLAAFLAVVVLFCFVGSFKNVITAAVEIPLSLLMAFILMRFAGMNLNMISLGGLALSAGMNVDASVVVLENIFRHFEMHQKNLSYSEKARIVMTAVGEVRLPIIASTMASLVVFLPLMFTKGLTNSLLGDLAKAVIFSHGLSAVVALVLVPTIRLHLISNSEVSEIHSPFEKWLGRLEKGYRSTLERFLRSSRTQWVVFGGVVLALPALVLLVLPRLNREVIGRPESDWLIVGVNSVVFNSSAQMESELTELEQSLMQKFPDKVAYTFAQVRNEQNGSIMLRLKSRRDISEMSDKAEADYKSTPTKSYWVQPWNPSELSIPDPPQMRVEIRGGTPQSRLNAAQDLETLIRERNIFDKVETAPTSKIGKGIVVRDMTQFGAQQEVLGRGEISHYLRVVTSGVYVGRTVQKARDLPIYLRGQKEDMNTVQQLAAIPVGFEGRILPMGALVQLGLEEQTPMIYRENQRDLILTTGRLNKVNLPEASTRKAEFTKSLDEIQKKISSKAQATPSPTLVAGVPDQELLDALDQLKWAIAISILLIFLTMVIQLGDVIQSLLVLVAIPLGFIGVVVSLWSFGSTLSLNSGLGTILLNGIAVANSIILVDFIQKLFVSGRSPIDSTIEASVARLRPILMTSLTTGLGMFPVALGLGDGGKILQPLGIAVCGGLWVSTVLTLFLVPALQYQYLKRRPAVAQSQGLRQGQSHGESQVQRQGQVQGEFQGELQGQAKV
ncbi:MAG: efflux RND transporter permease subunit [Bdellovibrionaceae bacterium]|nr:efflux RND transporter permease subunit [Pseudobdellovibrionaceae bacterium]